MHIGPILRSLRKSKSRSVLAIGMTALTFAIVVNCLQMMMVAREKMEQVSGFDENNLVSLRATPYSEKYRDEEFLKQCVREDLEFLRAQPEVISATQTQFIPWIGGGSSWECRPAGSEAGYQRMQQYPAGPMLAETLDVEIIEGRAFTLEEKEGESDSVIISRALGELFWPGERFVGKHLETPNPEFRPKIVGVIDEFYNPYGWPIEEYVMFWPGYRVSYDMGLRYLVRVKPEAMENIASLEELLESRGHECIIGSTTVPEMRLRYFGRTQTMIQVLGLIIALMVIVTSIGIFGMTYFSVADRTKQIGTRRALGASQADILKHFLTENWLITSLGLVVGLAFCVGLNILLVSGAGAQRLNIGLPILGMIAIWCVNLAAALVPSLRGMRISPVVATRT